MKIVHEKLKGLESKWNLTWDFLGHKKYVDPEMCSQRDWNQTLITKVNQISAQMHMSTSLDPGNTIVTGPKCAVLIESCEYFNSNLRNIGRFSFIVDDEIDENVIYVYGLNKIDECPKEKLNNLIGKIEIKNYEQTT